MRFLFCSRPAYGHLYPMMPLALAARDAGHDVTFATTGRFVAMLRELGFPTVRVGMTLEQARAQDGRPDLELAARIFIDVLASRTAADLAPLLDELAPDLVVYEQGDFGGAVAAGAAGIRSVCHAISPRMPVEAIEPAAREPVARLWASRDVESPPFDVFTGETYLDIVPSCFQHPPFLDHPARRPLRPVPWSEPGAGRPAWVGGGRRPLVYLTLGTVVGRTDNLAPAIQALGRLDADVLLALGSATGGPLGRVPDNVHAEAFVDQAAVLPHADLVVHHGGTGTVLGALAHGRRQLVLPKGADQFLNADVLRASGIADVLEPDAATVDAIEGAARAALDAPVAAATIAARDEIAAMPLPADALAGLLDQVRA